MVTWLALSAPPVISRSSLRRYTKAAPVDDEPTQGVTTWGSRQPAGSCVVGFAVLKFKLPPLSLMPPSSTTFPPEKVTVVPLLTYRFGQLIHQLPVTTIVPAA